MPHSTSVRRSYAQYCSLARALDAVGERWTILVIRELIVRPKRFGELLDGLPGISRNLLATRLKQLVADGIVRRRNGRYELTEDGEMLTPALTELARWGARRLGGLRPGDSFQGQWVMGTVAATADLEASRGIHETYQYDIEGDVFHVRVDDGEITPQVGPADDPDLLIRSTPAALAAIASGELPVAEALASGAVEVVGDAKALEHAIAIIGSAWGVD